MLWFFHSFILFLYTTNVFFYTFSENLICKNISHINFLPLFLDVWLLLFFLFFLLLFAFVIMSFFLQYFLICYCWYCFVFCFVFYLAFDHVLLNFHLRVEYCCWHITLWLCGSDSGPIQSHGHLVSHGQAFGSYQGTVSSQELFLKVE